MLGRMNLRVRGTARGRLNRVAITVGLAVLAGALLSLALSSALPLLITTTVLVFLAWAGTQTALSSAAATAISLLFMLAVSQPIVVFTGWTLETSNFVVMLGIAVIAAVSVVRRSGGVRELNRPSIALLLGSALVPVIATCASIATVVRSGGARIGWAMGNDAVWNTMSARFIVADGGLAPLVHPNPSPLASESMALLIAPGRDGLAPAALLEHDIAREMQGLLLMTIAAGVIASILVGGAVPPNRPVLRFVVAVVAGLFPWSWFVGGFAFALGFYNVLLGTVVLVALWAVWLDLRRRPQLAFLLVMAAATVMLAVWAPLVLLPLSMAAWIVIRELAPSVRKNHAVLAVIAVGIAQFVVYAVALTLPDLRRDGAALADDGAMVGIQPAGLLAGVLILVAVALLASGTEHGRRRLTGVFLVLVGAMFGIGYLVVQRLGDQEPWGYYAAKFGWFVLILAALIAMHAMIERTRAMTFPVRGISTITTLVVLMAVPGAIMLQVPPNGISATAFVPSLSIVQLSEPDSRDSVAAELFPNSDPGVKRMFARYFDDVESETFANGWLFQQSADASSDPIRAFGYTLDTNSTDQLCSALETWGTGVVVVTRDGSLGAELSTACPGVDVLIEAQ